MNIKAVINYLSTKKIFDIIESVSGFRQIAGVGCEQADAMARSKGLTFSLNPLQLDLFWGVGVLEPTLCLAACERPPAVAGSLCASDVHASCFLQLSFVAIG